MNRQAQKKLADMVAKYGKNLSTDHKRCEALLRDICPQDRLEVSLLVSAVRDGVPAELMSNGLPAEILLPRLVGRLQTQQGLSAECARWAVESWAIALGTEASTITAMTANQETVITSRPRPTVRAPRSQELLLRDHTLHGGIVFGIEGHIVEMQARAVDVLRKPAPVASVTKVSGMSSSDQREALDRIRAAFAKLAIPDSEVSILVSITPRDLPKQGSWLDLPLAILMLQAAGMLPNLPAKQENRFVLLGSIGIHGEVRRVPGALSIAYVAQPGQQLIVPTGNEKECALILAKPGHEGCHVYPVSQLSDVIDFFRGQKTLSDALKETIRFESYIPKAIDLGKIRGQELAKEAAIICAAGGHNLLLIGPPGEGKSLLASAVPGILPPLTNEEKVQLTKIYSACGELPDDGLAITRRPFRAIHHTASKQSVIGGGSGVPRPGEITLAHLGILFLDEIAEFSAATLESLRQPLESGEVNISRVKASMTFPCRFTLVAAMNPCPCGFYGTDKCSCREVDVRRYQKKISGPILDRIDLQVEMNRLSTEERFAEIKDNESPAVRHRITAARKRQAARFAKTDISHNAAIPGGQVRALCNFSTEAFSFFRNLIEHQDLSTRSMDRLAKVARTIADLEASEQLEPTHLEKASRFVIGGLLRESP